MTEQLRLHQRFRQRSAVHADEGSVPPRTERHNRARRQLLARPAFSAQDHRGVTGSHPPQRFVDTMHRFAAADHAAEGGSLADILPQQLRFELDPPLHAGFQQIFPQF